jgi:hypothetical protein
VSTAGALPRAGTAWRLSGREAAALFAAVVIVAVAWIGPVAGERRSGAAASDAPQTLPSDEVNVVLRAAAAQLSGIDSLQPAAQREAVASVTDGAVQLDLVRGGAAACVEATHADMPGETWSYVATTGAIGKQPC